MIAVRPLISKEDILRAYRPTEPPSDAVFRRLRHEGVVSEGIKIRPRRGGRLSGTITAFYSLNEDAAIAYRHGDLNLAGRARKLAERAESGHAAKALIGLASAEQPLGGQAATDLDGLYRVVAERDRRPFDELAARAMKDRESISNGMIALGALLLLATFVALRKDSAELASEAGELFSVPRTADIVRLAAAHAPVTVRMEQLASGMLLTSVERAWSLDEAQGSIESSRDPFGDLRPAMPKDLRKLLDDVPLRPVALTGPAMRWA